MADPPPLQEDPPPAVKKKPELSNNAPEFILQELLQESQNWKLPHGISVRLASKHDVHHTAGMRLLERASQSRLEKPIVYVPLVHDAYLIFYTNAKHDDDNGERPDSSVYDVE